MDQGVTFLPAFDHCSNLLSDLILKQSSFIQVFTLDIPKELVYQCDEMYLWYVPMANSNTYAPIGSKEVAVAGKRANILFLLLSLHIGRQTVGTAL